MSKVNLVLNLLQELSPEEHRKVVATSEATRLDPKNPSQAVVTRTTFMKESSVSKYRPKLVNSHGLDSGAYIDKILEDTVSTSYELLKELQSNRDQLSNISYVDITGKDKGNFSRNIMPWLQKDLLIAIKTKEQFDGIRLASSAAKIQIDLLPEKNKRYYMFNPSLLLPYSRADKGKHFDFIYLIYQYLKNYIPPAKGAYQACLKQHNNAMLKEYFKDNNQCTFDEFLDRSKEYINQCLAGKQPVLAGWFKLAEEQSKDKSVKL